MSRGYTVLWHSEAVVTHNVSWFQSVLNLWALLLLSCGVWLHVCFLLSRVLAFIPTRFGVGSASTRGLSCSCRIVSYL